MAPGSEVLPHRQVWLRGLRLALPIWCAGALVAACGSQAQAPDGGPGDGRAPDTRPSSDADDDARGGADDAALVDAAGDDAASSDASPDDGEASDAPSIGDSGTGDATPTLPASPLPFAVDLSTGTSLLFDQHLGCAQLSGSPEFRQRWATADNWILTLEVFAVYAGPGTYHEGPPFQGAQASLVQVVAGGLNYQSIGSLGHTLTFVMEHDDGNEAWGHVTISGMTNVVNSAQITLSPSTLPIWCPSIVH